MRRQILLILPCSLILACSAPAPEGSVQTIPLLEGERWWAGVITDSHLMPFEAPYEFDFFANTAGNQGQPLLVSNQGRYIYATFKWQIAML